jgi:hypothetical protein
MMPAARTRACNSSAQIVIGLRSWEQEFRCGGGPRPKNGGPAKRLGVVGRIFYTSGEGQINLGAGGGGLLRGILQRQTAPRTGAKTSPALREPSEGGFCAGAEGGMQQIQLSPNLPPPAFCLLWSVRGGGPHAHFPVTAEARSILLARSCWPAVFKGLGHAARCHVFFARLRGWNK